MGGALRVQGRHKNYSKPKQEYNSDWQIVELLCIVIFRTRSFWPMRPRKAVRLEREISNAGKNWILPKEINSSRFFWDSHWLEIWKNHLRPSTGPNGGSVANFISLGIIEVPKKESSVMSSVRLYGVQYVLCDLPFWREMHGGRERRVERELHGWNLNIEHNYCDFRKYRQTPIFRHPLFRKQCFSLKYSLVSPPQKFWRYV